MEVQKLTPIILMEKTLNDLSYLLGLDIVKMASLALYDDDNNNAVYRKKT
jgi:hypothetical protein